jgi:hypothetical protein
LKEDAAISTPGHYCEITMVGDVVIILKGGLLLRTNIGEEVNIAVLANQLPEGLVARSRVWVKGRLGQEKEVTHRRNLHFLQAEHVAIIKKAKTTTMAGKGGPP